MAYFATEHQTTIYPRFVAKLEELVFAQVEESCVPLTLILGVGGLGRLLAYNTCVHLNEKTGRRRAFAVTLEDRGWLIKKPALVIPEGYGYYELDDFDLRFSNSGGCEQILLIVPQVAAPKNDDAADFLAWKAGLWIREYGHRWARQQLSRYGNLQQVITQPVTTTHLQAFLNEAKAAA